MALRQTTAFITDYNYCIPTVWHLSLTKQYLHHESNKRNALHTYILGYIVTKYCFISIVCTKVVINDPATSTRRTQIPLRRLCDKVRDKFATI